MYLSFDSAGVPGELINVPCSYFSKTLKIAQEIQEVPIIRIKFITQCNKNSFPFLL